MSLLQLVSRLLIQQHINFLPKSNAFLTQNSVIGTLYISSFFVATAKTNTTFALYELLAIPFPYHGTRIRLTNIPQIVGLDFSHQSLITWTKHEADTCDFNAMSTYRETSPILNDWHDTCIFQILSHVNLSSCRTEIYRVPLFIHRLGSQRAISTINTLYCHSTSISSNTPSFQFHNTLRVIPAVALITISPGTTLLCDQFSISALSTHVKPFLSILDTSLINTSKNHTIDLIPSLTNSTRWQKLPAISNHLQAVIDYITNTTKLSPLNQNQAPRHPLLFYLLLSVIAILIIFFAGFFYWKWIRKPRTPLITFQFPSINTTPVS